MDDDQLITNVYRKIEREKVLINGANSMRQQTDNASVRQRLDAQIREGRKNISYLEERMRELQLRKMGQGQDTAAGSDGTLSPSQYRNDGPPLPPPKDGRRGYEGESGGYGDPGPGGYSQQLAGGNMMPARAPYAPPGPAMAMPKARPNYSKLGELRIYSNSL
jgi:hypothetical protein